MAREWDLLVRVTRPKDGPTAARGRSCSYPLWAPLLPSGAGTSPLRPRRRYPRNETSRGCPRPQTHPVPNGNCQARTKTPLAVSPNPQQKCDEVLDHPSMQAVGAIIVLSGRAWTFFLSSVTPAVGTRTQRLVAKMGHAYGHITTGSLLREYWRSMRRIWRRGKNLLQSGQTCMHEASYQRTSLNRGNWR